METTRPDAFHLPYAIVRRGLITGLTLLALLAGCSNDGSNESGDDTNADGSTTADADGETGATTTAGDGGPTLDLPGAEDDAGMVPGMIPSPIRVLPLGDSLTFGTSASVGATDLEGGYRIRLLDRLTDEGFDVDYVGTATNGPAGFDGDHESEPGASIAVIGDHWTMSADLHPHVVLLLAGTNDQLGITADQPPADAAAALGALVDRILSDEPGVVVVVAKVPPLVPGFLVGSEQPDRIDAYNALIPDLVQSRRESGAKVFLADLSLLNPALLGDGVHPSTMAGYDAMAQMWAPAVLAGIASLAN